MAKENVFHETAEKPERAILVGTDLGNADWPVEESLDELAALADTAGAEVVLRMSQRLDSPNPRTFIGEGKVTELLDAVRGLKADVVIFDDELSPSQQSNIEKILGDSVKVLDRTALILDIFALHATSREGKLQVELARNQYLYPRLRGMWSHLSQGHLGGGVGAGFGEGESQLQADRLLVRERITRIRRELEQLDSNRKNQRKQREASGVYRVALAGYTNAGKSSLLNALTGDDVLVYDKLFATLDSTTRQLVLPSGLKATLTDTVGFIQKLPHTLVEAFKSTLDEIAEADLVLLVVDTINRQRDAQVAEVRKVLEEIGASELPTLVVYNKKDLLEEGEIARLAARDEDHVFVSATTLEGLDELRERIEGYALAANPLREVLIPYAQGALVKTAHEECVVLSEEYTGEGTALKLRVPASLVAKFEPYERTGITSS